MKINILVTFDDIWGRVAFIGAFGQNGQHMWEAHWIGPREPENYDGPLILYCYGCDKDWAELFFESIPSKSVREMTPDEVADFLQNTQ